LATSLKHQRKEFGLTELMETLDVEKKTRAKDIHGKGVSLLCHCGAEEKSNMHSETKTNNNF